jgi:hypothetical protein
VPLNVVHHLRWPRERLLHAVAKKYALSFLADKWKGLHSRRFFLDDKRWGKDDALAVSSRHFTAAAESQHKTGGLDPALDGVFWGDIRDVSTDKVDQLRLFGDLMFNHRLGVLFFLLSVILPLDVFRRAAAEVICSVFFRDDISTPTPSTADCGSKSPNLCLYVRPLNSVCPSFQLLSLLLKCSDLWIRRERGKYVVRYMNRCAGIAHKAHVGEHTKDAVCRGTLEDSRLHIKPHPLVDVGPIIHGRVRVVSHNLVPNGIGGST